MKKLLTLAISCAILIFLYMRLDFAEFLESLRALDRKLLSFSLLLLVLLVFVSALRLRWLASLTEFKITARDAVAATFAANALNMFLPGKAGDILKASVLSENDTDKLPLSIGIGIWEKLAELSLLIILSGLAFAALKGKGGYALLMLGAGSAGLTLLLSRAVSKPLFYYIGFTRRFQPVWTDIQRSLMARPLATLGLLVLSTALWLLHLVQICLMAAALGMTGGPEFWIQVAANLPIAILAGLIPLTFSGVGTRDAMLVYLLAPVTSIETAAALGALFWLRYLVPGLMGLVAMPRFLRSSGKHAQQLRMQRLQEPPAQ